MNSRSSLRSLAALASAMLLALSAAAGCSGQASADDAGSCHTVEGADGTTSTVCGCSDGVDEDGSESTYCSEESVGSTEQAMGIACGIKRGGTVDVGSCRCYANTSVGIVLVGTGMDCFVG